MMRTKIISLINEIKDNKSFKIFEKDFFQLLDFIKKNNNFYYLLIIILYSRYNKLLDIIYNYGIDLKITNKSGKNLLFYTIVLKNFNLTNKLIKFKVTPQKKYFNKYIVSSFSNYKFNVDLCLNLIYYGIDYDNCNFLEKSHIDIYNIFVKKHFNEINIVKKIYNLWNRRKYLAYIVNDIKMKNNISLISHVFLNDLIINEIKQYL